jgi:hypothetical protein
VIGGWLPTASGRYRFFDLLCTVRHARAGNVAHLLLISGKRRQHDPGGRKCQQDIGGKDAITTGK